MKCIPSGVNHLRDQYATLHLPFILWDYSIILLDSGVSLPAPIELPYALNTTLRLYDYPLSFQIRMVLDVVSQFHPTGFRF